MSRRTTDTFGMDREDVQRIQDALFFDPPNTRERVIRFSALIIFSSIIATGGLLSNSTAAVIGAMIIAPLMVPIMAIVVASVVGTPERAWRSAVVLTAGIAMAIGVGWLIGELVPHGLHVTNSTQIMSRTSPALVDLMIALASGGAGAYALSREDVSDSLPGVAISISLVPPLNTAGILLSAGESSLARGALLLFITNMAAIFLAGTVTFVVTGLARSVGRKASDLKYAMVATVAFVVLVTVPLSNNSFAIWKDATAEDKISDAVAAWIGDNEWELYSVEVDGNEVEAVLGGEGDLPPSEPIIEEVANIIGDDMELTVRVIGVTTETITSNGAAEADSS